MKPWLSIAVLALVLPALAPSASAAAGEAARNVCTYDIIESVAVCVMRDPAGRTCVIVYVGPSAPVHRCVDPRDVADAVNPCVESYLLDAGACVTTPEDHVCVEGHWGHYPVGDCVYVGPKAQAASVDLFCRIGDRDCDGFLVCVHATRYTEEACVRDPCDDTACWGAQPAAPRCVVIVPEGHDMGEKVCWDLRAECKVWYQRTTYVGTITLCLVPPGGPTPARAPWPCMDRYWEESVGPVRVVSRSSCEYEVYYNDRPLLS